MRAAFVAVLLCAVAWLPAVQVLSWDDGIASMRAQEHPGYAIFIGRRHARLIELLKSSEIQTGNVPIVHLSAASEVLNPYTERRVPGTTMISLLTGPVGDLTGGSLIFFDAEGALVPSLTLIQNFHRNRPAVIELYCRMLVSPLRDKLSLAEFARFEGLPIGLELVAEVQAGAHRDFSHIFREVDAADVLPRAVLGDGGVHDLRGDLALTVVTRDPNGEVFIALMREIHVKLAVNSGATVQRPPLIVAGPAQATYPALDALGITYEAATLTKEQLRAFPSPAIVIPQAGERPVTLVSGFVPGQVLAEYLLPKEVRALLNDYRVLAPDIPVGDTDIEAGQ
ncbi:MAG: hypothetical protein PF961_10525 [Planctomycetota bacterium]|jgi:hypothetical protein|nr:hypothetical protein [Planctomycetota bacterium]